MIARKVLDEYTLDAATTYARNNNLALLKLMNDLTTTLENSTKAKASKLQLIQTIGLILSLILFLMRYANYVLLMARLKKRNVKRLRF